MDVPFEEILSEFRRSKDLFLDYIAHLKKCNNDRIGLPVVSKIYNKTYLLACFCIFYMTITAIRQKVQPDNEVQRESIVEKLNRLKKTVYPEKAVQPEKVVRNDNNSERKV